MSALADDGTRKLPNENNPFVGPWSIPATRRIFGRDWESATLHDMVVAERVVLLFGPSGCGKTSLLGADGGVLSALEKNRFRSIGIARLDSPGADALGCNRYLASVCCSVLGKLPEQFGSATDDSLREELQSHIEKLKPARVVLVLDAFERLLTLVPDDYEAKAAFLQQLDKLAESTSRLFLLIAMREEFIARLEEIARPVPPSARFRLSLLDGDSAIEAIIGPAALKGVKLPRDYASQLARNLANAGATAAESDTSEPKDAWLRRPLVEPLHLQVTCHRLWQDWQKLGAENAFGGAEAAKLLNVTVDEALLCYYQDTLEYVLRKSQIKVTLGDQRHLREFIAEKLITSAGLRDQVWHEEALGLGISEKMLTLLEECYLLRPEQRGNRTSWELSHDRLVRPIKDEYGVWLLKNLRSFQLLALSYRNDPNAPLLSRSELRKAHAWAARNPDAVTEAEQAYFKASGQRHRRLRLIAFAAAGTVLFSALCTGVALHYNNQRHLREEEKQIAQSAMDAARSKRDNQLRIQRDLEDSASDAAYALRVGDFERAMSEADSATEAAAHLEVPTPSTWTDLISASLVRWYVQRFARKGQPLVPELPRALTNTSSGSTSMPSSLPYTALSLSPDGRWVAVSRNYSSLHVIDTRPTNAIQHDIPKLGDLGGRAIERVFVAADSDIGTPSLYLLARGGSVWRGAPLPQAQFKRVFKCTDVSAVGVSHDGSQILVTRLDRYVRGPPIFRISLLGQQIGTDSCPDSHVDIRPRMRLDLIAISRSGAFAALAGSQSDTLYLLSRSPRGMELAGEQKIGRVVAMTFDADGSRLAVAQAEGGVLIFSLHSTSPALRARLALGTGKEPIVDVAFIGRDRLAVADQSTVIQVWDLPSRQPSIKLLRNDTAPTQIAVSKDGRLYSAGQDGNLLFWPASVFSDSGVLDLAAPIKSFCNGPANCARTAARAVQPSAVTVRPDLREVAIGYATGDVFLYSTTERNLIRRLEPAGPKPRTQITRIAYSADSRLLALGDRAGRIDVYDAEGQLVDTAWHADFVSGLAFGVREQGLALFSSSWDGRRAVRDLNTHTSTFEPQEPLNVAGVTANVNAQYNSLAVDQSSKRVIVTQNSGPLVLPLEEFPGGENLVDNKLPQAASNKIAWADYRGDVLVDAGLDGIQRVHDLRQRRTATLPRYPSRIIKQMWDGQGVAMLSLSNDAVIRAYDVMRARDLFAIQLPASRDRDHYQFAWLDMHLACRAAASLATNDCTLVATLGKANRIYLINITGIPRQRN